MKIEIELDGDRWFIVTYTHGDEELHGAGATLSEALYELTDQIYGGERAE